MRRAPDRKIPIVLATFLVALGCGPAEGPPPTEVWTPEDHAQPEQADPNRRPRQVRARTERSENPRRRAALALWNVSCASCHGRVGQGDGPARPADMVSFQDPEWQERTSNEDIARVIAQGRGMMPPFGDTLPAQSIASLVELIRVFGTIGRAQEAPQPEPQGEEAQEPQANPPE
ncbi:MAG: cytochrome c [Myxococcota bacterium]